MSFKSIPISTRLVLILVIAFFGTLVLSAVALHENNAQMERDYERSVRSLVESAHAVVVHFEALERSGTMSRAQAQEAARSTLRSVRYDGGEYFYIFDTNGVGVMHPVRAEFEGQVMLGKVRYGDGRDLIGDVVATVRDAPAGFLPTEFPRPGTSEPVPKLQYLMKFEPWGWVIGSGVYTDDLKTEFRRSAVNFGLVVLAVMAVLVLLSWRVVRSVTHQLGGEPAYAVAIMHRVADGDLQVDVQVKGGADSLLGTLAGMLRQLRGMMRDIGDNAEQVAGNSREISGVARSVATASDSQTEATSAIAAAIEQMTVSIGQISESATGTERNSSRAAELAGQGAGKAELAAAEMKSIAATVGEAAQKIQHLVSRADEVGTIANVIKEIAAQTNLLALNAAIEAARAGEQGRGFAVVADEVRGLAERTAAATVQIEQVIGGIQAETRGTVEAMARVSSQVDSGVGLVLEATDSLREIRSGTGEALGRIRDVADATKEQSAASTAIAQQVEQIAQMVEGTSGSMRAAVRAVEQLEGLADNLHNLVARFRY